MKNLKGSIFSFFMIAGLICLCVSCTTIASAAGESAQSISNPRLANAVSQTSGAIGRAAEDISPEQAYYIGRAVAATLLTNYKVYTENPALTAYLNQICQAIVVNSPQPELYNGYHVAILDNAEINAFATSGGHIFITRGLLECVHSEDALAAVIAHEIAHIQLQHSIKAIKTSRIHDAIRVTGSSAVNLAAEGTVLAELTEALHESVGDIMTTMVNNGYSQSQEFDADTLALALLADTGYEPSSLMEMLTALKANQPNHAGGFNNTHPAPDKRLSNAEKSLGKYQVRDTRAFRQNRFNSVL
jgi:predicted Zn-dependent protease